MYVCLTYSFLCSAPQASLEREVLSANRRELLATLKRECLRPISRNLTPSYLFLRRSFVQGHYHPCNLSCPFIHQVDNVSIHTQSPADLPHYVWCPRIHEMRFQSFLKPITNRRKGNFPLHRFREFSHEIPPFLKRLQLSLKIFQKIK